MAAAPTSPAIAIGKTTRTRLLAPTGRSRSLRNKKAAQQLKRTPSPAAGVLLRKAVRKYHVGKAEKSGKKANDKGSKRACPIAPRKRR